MEGKANSGGNDTVRRRVGLAYDERMCLHHTPDGDDHPECPDRIRVIWNKLRDSGLLSRSHFLFLSPLFHFNFTIFFMFLVWCV